MTCRICEGRGWRLCGLGFGPCLDCRQGKLHGPAMPEYPAGSRREVCWEEWIALCTDEGGEGGFA